MKISIITVTYNSAAFISECISSVNNQTFPNVEHIFIYGKSTDSTLEIIKKEAERNVKIVSEEDNGIYDAMNKGIQLASGEYVGILNSDDLYAYPDALKDIILLLKETGRDSCYADLDYVDQDNVNKVVRRWKSGSYKTDMFLRGWMPPHPTFFVKRQIYDKYGSFNLALGTASDYEIMLRLLYKHKITVTYLPKTIIKMRIGGASNVSLINRLKANKNDRIAWEVNDLNRRFYTIILKPLRKISQFLP